jgi:prevent-host-death family protein
MRLTCSESARVCAKCTSAHAKNHFGELIDAARAAPVAITKYDRTVVVMVAAEEYDRISCPSKRKKAQRPKSKD